MQTDMDSRQTETKALQQYVQKSKEELQKLAQQLKEQKVGWAGLRRGAWPNRSGEFRVFSGKQQTPFTADVGGCW